MFLVWAFLLCAPSALGESQPPKCRVDNGVCSRVPDATFDIYNDPSTPRPTMRRYGIGVQLQSIGNLEVRRASGASFWVTVRARSVRPRGGCGGDRATFVVHDSPSHLGRS